MALLSNCVALCFLAVAVCVAGDDDKLSKDFEQFMDWKTYLNYQSFMQRAAGASHMVDHDQYMNFKNYLQSSGLAPGSDKDTYADYARYMKKNPGFAVMDYDQYIGVQSFSKSSVAATQLASPAQLTAEDDKQPSDYSQYTDKFASKDAADFDKYLKTQSSKAGDFKSFIEKYMADYEDYLHSGSSKAMDFEQYMGSHAAAYSDYTSSGGKLDFQQYMGKYASDYGSYLKSKGKMTLNEFMDKFSADFNQYVDKFSGSEEKTGHPTNLAATSVHQAAASPGGFDYQQFMDFSKYIPGASGSQDNAGNYQQYMSTYSKSVPGQGQSGSAAAGAAGDSGNGDYGKYMDFKQYTGISDKYTNQDWASSWKEYQAKQMAQGQGGQQLPYSAADCKTLEELKAWHTQQLELTYQWVPDMFQDNILKQVESDYQTNRARLLGSQNLTVAEPPLPVSSARSGQAPEEAADESSWNPSAEVGQIFGEPSEQKDTSQEPSLDLPPMPNSTLLEEPSLMELAAVSANTQLAELPHSQGGHGRAFLCVMAGLALPAALAMIAQVVQQARRPSRGTDFDSHFIALDAA